MSYRLISRQVGWQTRTPSKTSPPQNWRRRTPLAARARCNGSHIAASSLLRARPSPRFFGALCLTQTPRGRMRRHRHRLVRHRRPGHEPQCGGQGWHPPTPQPCPATPPHHRGRFCNSARCGSVPRPLTHRHRDTAAARDTPRRPPATGRARPPYPHQAPLPKAGRQRRAAEGGKHAHA